MEDLLGLEAQFSAEQKMARDAVLAFVDKEIKPVIGMHFEQATFAESWVQQMADLGLFGLLVPKQYGGTEVDNTTYGLICQALESGDSGLRSIVSVQNALCMYPILSFGTEKQKSDYLPLMCQGKRMGCFGLTEPDSGSDPASMKTTAKKVEGGWLLNGAKMWVTNATRADVAIVWAKTSDGIRGFIVDKNDQGFLSKETKHKMSLRASITGELIFSDCFVGEDRFLPGSAIGLAAALKCLTQARFGIAWGVIGAAMDCFETALAYTKQRQQFGKPLAACQLIQKDLVDMLNEICKANAMNRHLALLKDEGKASFEMISLAKMNACREALAISRKARNMLGANGISLEYPVIRHMQNLESVFTYEGTDNIHHLIVGKAITGLSAF